MTSAEYFYTDGKGPLGTRETYAVYKDGDDWKVLSESVFCYPELCKCDLLTRTGTRWEENPRKIRHYFIERLRGF